MRLKGFLGGLLILAYTFALVMSTGHLSEWYRLTLGSLPGWFAVGLAAALEMSAFLLSLLSNSLLKGSRWASWGAVVALGLVWVGNYFSMRRAGEGIPEVEIFLSSLFVPVSTYVVAKVLGELLEVDPRVARVSSVVALPESAKLSRGQTHLREQGDQDTGYAHDTGFARDTPVPPVLPVDRDRQPPRRDWRRAYLEALATPRGARELVETLGVAKPTVYKQLKILEKEGRVRNLGGKWVRVEEEAVHVG